MMSHSKGGMRLTVSDRAGSVALGSPMDNSESALQV